MTEVIVMGKVESKDAAGNRFFREIWPGRLVEVYSCGCCIKSTMTTHVESVKRIGRRQQVD